MEWIDFDLSHTATTVIDGIRYDSELMSTHNWDGKRQIDFIIRADLSVLDSWLGKGAMTIELYDGRGIEINGGFQQVIYDGKQSDWKDRKRIQLEVIKSVGCIDIGTKIRL